MKNDNYEEFYSGIRLIYILYNICNIYVCITYIDK